MGQSTRVKHYKADKIRAPGGGKDFARQRGRGGVAKRWKKKISRDSPPLKP